MKHYWIIGHPLKFCLTEPVMNGAFEALGIEARFETKDVEPDDFDEVLAKVRSGELAGVMATRPYKTPVFEKLDDCDTAVEAVGAVNLALNEEGKLCGYNSDGMGALGAIKAAYPSVEGKKVHILGAGGAARAAAAALKDAGAEVSIWNRTVEKAQRVAEQLGIEWVEDMRQWDGKPDVLVNATALSDQSKQSTLVPFPLWENVDLAMDAVYGKTSLFLEEAKAMNVSHILPGEVWFLEQATHMFERITGQEAPRELMEKLTHEAQVIQER